MQELATHPVVRLVMLTLFVASLAAGSWLVLLPFAVPILWAAIIAYASWPLYKKLLVLLRGNKNVAALMMTIAMAALVILPLLWLLLTLKAEFAQVANVIKQGLAAGDIVVPAFVQELPLFGHEISHWLNQMIAQPGQLKVELQALLSSADKLSFQILGEIGRNIAKMGLALLTLFFVYKDGDRLLTQIQTVLQSMLGARVKIYLEAAGGATRGVVYGVLLTALIQGVVAGFGYWAAGVGSPTMLAAITVLFALIPFGTPLVWGSIGVWLMLTGQTAEGVGLLLWGALVVSWVDNIVRPLIVTQSVKIPFILAFLGVLGGLAAFGLVGLFLGPVILAVAFSVWQEWIEVLPNATSEK
ncbi:MAG: AI-2E family transporter [Methylophilus sp.]|nr:AI-2E family transporter [Methylophilus sp.]